jgi:UDP-GlcNAc:undecaprenyl-phosphate/decaprenyl-phosphate GlcNAc-1-phosphate transferase
MSNLITGFLVSFFVTYVAMPVIIRIASMKKLVDVPDSRKIHKSPIPSLGGFGVFAGFILALLIAVPSTATAGLQYYVGAAFLLYLVGLKDDVVVITPLKKLMGQITAAFILINLADLRLVSMHGIFGVHELSYTVSLIVSYLGVILVINAFNLIDGVDGLAGTLGVVSSLIFGIYFYFAHDPLYAVMGLSLVGALGAFLLFNYTPAKIFMGDTGSMLIGLVNTILLFHFIKIADAPGAQVPVTSAPVIGLAILMVPLFDTVRVFSIRIFLHRRSPFSPDRNHIHHLLLDCGFSHSATTLTLVLYNLVLIVAAVAFRGAGNYFLLAGLVGASLSFTALVAFFRQPRRAFTVMKKVGAAVTGQPADGALIEASAVQRKVGSHHGQKGGVVVSAGMQPLFSMEEE